MEGWDVQSKFFLTFVTLMVQVSPRTPRSRMMRWNSAEGILIEHWYSCSGMPRCSQSMSINFISKSEIRSCGRDGIYK